MKEQEMDEDIGPIFKLVQQGKHLQYTCKERDFSRMRVLLKYKQDLVVKNGLLYRKVKLKNHDTVVNQFVLPKTHRWWATLALHDDYGHLGMEKTLGLLQERFFWWKMVEDVWNHIRTCGRCTKYKQQPEREKLKPISCTYPLELVHLNLSATTEAPRLVQLVALQLRRCLSSQGRRLPLGPSGRLLQ